MFKKKLFTTVLVTIFAVLLFSAAVWGSNFVLKYNYQVGEVILYQDTLEIDLKVNDEGNIMNNQVEFELDYRQTITDVGAGQIDFGVTFDDIRINRAKLIATMPMSKEPREVDMVNRMRATYLPLLKDGWVNISMDPWGNIIEHSISKAIEQQLQGNVFDFYQRIVVALPKMILQEGSTWQDELIVPLADYGSDMVVPITYTIVGWERIDNYDCIFIESIQDDEIEIELEDGYKGYLTSRGHRHIYFEPKLGRVIKAEDEHFIGLTVYNEKGQVDSSLEAKTISNTIQRQQD